MVQSLFSVFRTFVESAAQDLRCTESSTGLQFCPSFKTASLQSKLSGTSHRKESNTVPIPSLEARSDNVVQRETKRQRLKHHMPAHTITEPSDIRQKIHRKRSRLMCGFFMQNVTLSVALERKFLEVRPRIRLNSTSSVQCSVAPISEKDETVSPWKRERGEVPRAAPCASASLQRGKDFPVGSEDRFRKGRSARPRRREILRRKSPMQSSAQERGNKSSFHHIMCSQKGA